MFVFVEAEEEKGWGGGRDAAMISLQLIVDDEDDGADEDEDEPARDLSGADRKPFVVVITLFDAGEGTRAVDADTGGSATCGCSGGGDRDPPAGSLFPAEGVGGTAVT